MKRNKLDMEGIFINGVKVDDLIRHLESYKATYGNQPIYISVEGNDDCFVQFDYFENALVINVEEDDPY